MKKLQALVLSTVFLATGAAAEVTQDCIFTGKISRTATGDALNPIKLTFHNVEQGDAAPCRAARARSTPVRFKANPEDKLDQLPSGTPVRYQYQRRNGEDQWLLIEADAPLLTADIN